MASDDQVPAFEEQAPLLLVTYVILAVVQSGVLFLPGETGEAGAPSIAVGHEEFFAMENRGVPGLAVVSMLQG